MITSKILFDEMVTFSKYQISISIKKTCQESMERILG